MSMLVAWVVYPLVLGALCGGLGLLVDLLTGRRLPGTLLLLVGFAAMIVLGEFTTATDGTSELTVPLVVGLAAVGGGVLAALALRPRRPADGGGGGRRQDRRSAPRTGGGRELHRNSAGPISAPAPTRPNSASAAPTCTRGAAVSRAWQPARCSSPPPAGESGELISVPLSEANKLCGKRWDWIEAVGAG